MRAEEIRELGELAGDAVGGFATRIHDMHQGVAGRVFDSIGRMALPVQVVHDQVAQRSYAAVTRACAATLRAGAGALSATRGGGRPSIHDTLDGRLALGALNGAFGDLLAQRESCLALPMTVRHRARDVALSEAALVRAFPRGGARIALFMHGLCETEEAWRLGAERHVPYGTRLRSELGYTPVYIRYNSGRHISENGRDLAALLDQLVQGWPSRVSEIAIIGHSMGGLVARSASYYGREREWASWVRHIFTLGTPHKGAPLEQAAAAACAALRRLPETRGFANAINLRSAGVKDLGRGYLVDEDWTEDQPDVLLRKIGREIPFLPSANHYFISAAISQAPDSPTARVVGDLLVLRASAWAQVSRGERLRFPVENYRHIGGINHFDLLNHPAVYQQIRRWLGSERALPAPRMAERALTVETTAV